MPFSCYSMLGSCGNPLVLDSPGVRSLWSWSGYYLWNHLGCKAPVFTSLREKATSLCIFRFLFFYKYLKLVIFSQVILLAATYFDTLKVIYFLFKLFNYKMVYNTVAISKYDLRVIPNYLPLNYLYFTGRKEFIEH